MGQVQTGSVSQVLNLLFSGSAVNAENAFKIKAQAIGVDKEDFSEQLQLAVSQLLQNEEFGDGGLDFDNEFLGQAEQFVNQGGKIFPPDGADEFDFSQLDLSQLEQLTKALSKIEELGKFGDENALSDKEQQALLATIVGKNKGLLKQFLADANKLEQRGIDTQFDKIDALANLKEQIATTLDQAKSAINLDKQPQHNAIRSDVIGNIDPTNAKLNSASLLVEQIAQLESASKHSLASAGKVIESEVTGSIAKKENFLAMNGIERNLAKLDGETLSKEEITKLATKEQIANEGLLDEKGKRLEAIQLADKKLSGHKEKFNNKFLQNLDDSQFFVKDKTVSLEQQKVSSLFQNASPEITTSHSAKAHSNPASQSFASSLGSFIPTANNEQTAQSISSVNTKLEPSSEFTQGLNLKQNFAPNLSMRIQWMFRQSLSSAEILMDPPEMGPLSVKVNQSNGETNILFQVTNLATKETLEDNLAKLKEMLDQQGINLGEAQVQHKDSQLAEKENGESENHSDEMLADESEQTENLVIESDHLVDTYS